MALPSSLAMSCWDSQGRPSYSKSGIEKQAGNVGTFPNPREEAEPRLHRGRTMSPSPDCAGTAEPPRQLLKDWI